MCPYCYKAKDIPVKRFNKISKYASDKFLSSSHNLKQNIHNIKENINTWKMK